MSETAQTVAGMRPQQATSPKRLSDLPARFYTAFLVGGRQDCVGVQRPRYAGDWGLLQWGGKPAAQDLGMGYGWGKGFKATKVRR